MYLNIRSSKLFFHRKFQNFIRQSEPFNKVLDCACAKAKNRPLFLGKEYHGVDISQKSIDISKKKYAKDAQCFFYQDDMVDLQSEVCKHTFPLAISSHTLYWLDDDKKQVALEGLVDLIKTGGNFILQCANEEVKYTNTINEQFKNVTVYTYRGSLTRNWEEFLIKLFKTPSLPDVANKVNVVLRYFLFSISFVLSYIDFFGEKDQVIIFFNGKK